MKKMNGFLLGLLLSGVPVLPGWDAATDGTASLDFSTVTEGWGHSPNHVLAVWITDARTNYVATVLKHGEKRWKYLSAWNAARRGDRAADGVSGATLTSHGPVSAAWNGRDREDAVVPDGTYLFFVEFTEGNFKGPRAAFPFLKGPQAQTGKHADQENFKDIRIAFTPEKQ